MVTLYIAYVCRGISGERVNAIVEELRGEKIDIIVWSDDPFEYIARALSPAKVISVIADADEKIDKAVKTMFALANSLGIPAKNIYRDINALINTIKNVGNDYRTNFGDKFKEGFSGEELSKGEKLYQSIVSGDSKLVDYYKSTYKDESTYLSAVRKALRDNDPRLREAALARLEGDTDTYWDLFLDVVEEGKFEPELIKAAFEAEYNYHNDKKNEAEERGETYP